MTPTALPRVSPRRAIRVPVRHVWCHSTVPRWAWSRTDVREVDRLGRVTDPSVFDEHVAAWQAWQRTPWGRLRYRLVAQLLDRHAAALPPGSVVLDVGGADGADSRRFAERGLAVTVVDSSAAMLAIGEQQEGVRTAVLTLDDLPARWPDLLGARADLVLCHNVIQYCHDLEAAVACAVSPLAPGGVLSLIATNPVNHVLSTAVRDLDPSGALAMLASETRYAGVFDHDVRRISADVATQALSAAGCEVVARHGVLCVNHLITADERKGEPEFAADLERLELAVADLSPYRDIAAMWMLVARRR